MAVDSSGKFNLPAATRGVLALLESEQMPVGVRRQAAIRLGHEAETLPANPAISIPLLNRVGAVGKAEANPPELADEVQKTVDKLKRHFASGPVLVETKLAEPGPARGPAPQQTSMDILREAQRHLQQKKYEKAKQTLEEAESAWTGNEEKVLGHTLLGRAYEGVNEKDKAILHYRKAVDASPALSQAEAAFAGLARVVPEAELDETKEQFGKKVQEYPDASGPALGLAALAERQGNQTEAVTRYQEAEARTSTLETRAAIRSRTERLQQELATQEQQPDTSISDLLQLGAVNVAGQGNIVANEINVALDSLETSPGLPPADARRLIEEIGRQIAQTTTLSQNQRVNFQIAQEEAERALQAGHVARAANALRLPYVNYLFIDKAAYRHALIRAAREYREAPHRRTILFLRSLARKQIRELLTEDYVTETWEKVELQEARHLDLVKLIWSQGKVQLAEAIGGQQSGEASVQSEDGYTLDEIVSESFPALTTREWRDLHRRDKVKVFGNLLPYAANARAAFETDLLWEGLKRLLYQHKGAQKYRSGWQRVEYSGLPPLMSTIVLSAFEPDRYLPFDRVIAHQTLVNLHLEDRVNELTLTYRAYMDFVQKLLADDDLGFETLDDVGFFLQQIATGAIPHDVRDEDENAPVEIELDGDVRLDPKVIDSVLWLPPEPFDQMSSALNAGNHVILIGPPGTGKTTLAHDVCRCGHDRGYNRGFISVTATADWTTFDTVGGYMPTVSGDLQFSEGVFLRAIAEQKWLVIDEINRADIDKAFGELFTVLSGQQVTLPYRRGYDPIRILPPGSTAQSEHDYVIPKRWRIIGTMNVFDKASLFEMSYAFMRRFAFVDVRVPGDDIFPLLIDSLLSAHLAKVLEEQEKSDALIDLGSMLKNKLFKEDAQIMVHRKLGPAIAQDMIGYLELRLRQNTGADDVHEYLGEAFLLYAVPQFDGLEREKIKGIFDFLTDEVFAQQGVKAGQAIRDRIRELFPQYADDFRNEKAIRQQREEGL